MPDFDVKSYAYDKYAKGVSTARVAESLGISVEELNKMLNEVKNVDLGDIKKLAMDENNNIEKLEKEEIPEETINRKKKKNKKKDAEPVEEDASWMTD